MASIRRRNGGITVSVRRKGYRPIYRTFDDTPEGEREAEQWAEDVEMQIRHGRHVDQDNSGQTRLRDALMRYLKEVTPTKKSSGAKREHNRILALCRIPLTDRTMDEVTSMLIARYRDEKLEAGYSPSTINSDLAILSRCYNIARTEWGINVSNPVKGVRRPQQKDQRERRLELGEEEALLAKLGHPWREAVVLLLETAMRRGELFGLQWQDVKLVERYLLLRDTKNKEDRSVPLSSRAIAVLKELPRQISSL